jgi:hypothetical protein
MKKKGFVIIDKNKDHYFCCLYVNGKKTSIRTKISRGSSYHQLSTSLIIAMTKDLRMPTKESFFEFIDCTYSYDNYITDLKKNGMNIN